MWSGGRGRIRLYSIYSVLHNAPDAYGDDEPCVYGGDESRKVLHKRPSSTEAIAMLIAKLVRVKGRLLTRVNAGWSDCDSLLSAGFSSISFIFLAIDRAG